MPVRRWCPCRLGVNYYQAIARGLLGEETWSLYARMLVFCPPPGGVLSAVKFLTPLELARLEGGGYISEYELAFPDGLGHGIFNPSVFSSASDQTHQGKNGL